MTYSAGARVPHMGKCIVSFRPALMLYCRLGVVAMRQRTGVPCGHVGHALTVPEPHIPGRSPERMI